MYAIRSYYVVLSGPGLVGVAFGPDGTLAFDISQRAVE